MTTGSAEDLRDRPERWEVLETLTRFEGAKIAVRTDTVAMPGGISARRDLVVHPGSVGILVLDDSDPHDPQVLVLSQYRHPVGMRLWELPAGLLDAPGESAVLAAARELAEEAHLAAEEWRVLVDLYSTPGCSDEAVRIFLARGHRPLDGERPAGVHEEADMELRWVALRDLVAGVLAGRLTNPLVVIGSLALQAARTGAGIDALRRPEAPWAARPATVP